jgi:hypothetical protein
VWRCIPHRRRIGGNHISMGNQQNATDFVFGSASEAFVSSANTGAICGSNSISSGSGNDVIAGSVGVNWDYAYGGNNVIYAGSGSDTIYGDCSLTAGSSVEATTPFMAARVATSFAATAIRTTISSLEATTPFMPARVTPPSSATARKLPDALARAGLSVSLRGFLRRLATSLHRSRAQHLA